MITLDRKINNIKRLFNIYSKAEADEKDVEYVYWKEANANNYAISDDDYVFRVISKKTYKDRYGAARSFYKFPFGNKWDGKKAVLYFKSYQSGEIQENWEKKEMGKTRTKNAVNAYVAMMLSKKPIDWEILGNIYRPDQKIPSATVKRLFKMDKVQQMVETKTKSVLADKGVTKDSIIQTILDAIEVARHKQDAGNMLKGADNLADYLEMKPTKRMITDTMQIDVTSEIEDQIEKEEKRLLVTRESKSTEKDEEWREPMQFNGNEA